MLAVAIAIIPGTNTYVLTQRPVAGVAAGIFNPDSGEVGPHWCHGVQCCAAGPKTFSSCQAVTVGIVADGSAQDAVVGSSSAVRGELKDVTNGGLGACMHAWPGLLGAAFTSPVRWTLGFGARREALARRVKATPHTCTTCKLLSLAR